MATLQQQISPAEARKQRAMNLQSPQEQTTPKVYDESTTEGQVLSTRQQIQSSRVPLQQFKSQYLFPKRRERGFTDRRSRAQIVQAGQGVSEQLQEIQQQEQAFEREVATKAPEYALQEQKQQALLEAKQSVQARIDSLKNKIQNREKSIKNYEQKERSKNKDYSDKIDSLEDDIDEYQSELRVYEKGLKLSELDLIKQHFSGYIKNKANYERDYAEAKNKQYAEFKKMKEDPKFQETLNTLNLNKNVSLSEFNKAVSNFNKDVEYKNQLLKVAEQKGGVQFLSPEQQKVLGFDSQGFTYYKEPLKGWVDPRTGKVIEMSFINEQIPKSLGYQPIDISGYNRQTGQYIRSFEMTPSQKRMYEEFQKNPKIAKLFYNFDINQSEAIPEKVISYGSTITPPKTTIPFDQLVSPSGSAYSAAMRVQPYTVKEEKMMEYKLNPSAFINKYGYGLNEKGQILHSGGVSGLINVGPLVTWKDKEGKFNLGELGKSYIRNIKDVESTKSAFQVATIAALPRTIATFGTSKALGFTFADKIKAPIDYIYSKTYQPKSFLGQFGKASLTSYVVLSSPTLSSAYGYSFLKGAVKDPKAVYEGVVQQAKERPGELLGFAVGGKLIQKGLGYAEYKLRGGIETKKINLPGYGEVIVQNIPKYKQVVWIKGAFAASEKVKIMTQINSLLGKKSRIFVQVSGQGIPMQVFSSTKNLGFKVTQLQNPLRGLYQAPPFQFLKKYQTLTKTQAGALSYYAGKFKRDSILPNPLKAIKALLTKDTITKQRPFQYLERTGKGVQTPKWIQSVAKALDSGKGIPKSYQSIINKYFKAFLDKKLEYRGKNYVGLDKLKLVNELNLRGKGSGIKLKVYAALLEYQNINRVKLPGGAEVLSGIAPFGPESQVVVALDTKFFAKTSKDLRVGVKPTVTSKIIEFITGTKRGQYVSRIDGQLVEIMPVRSFSGKIKVKPKLPKVTKTDVIKLDNFLTNVNPPKTSTFVDFIRRRTDGEYVSPPRPFPLTQRTQEVRRDDRPIISRNPLIVVRDELRIPDERRPLDRIIPRTPIREIRERPIQRARPELRRPELRRPDERRPLDRIIPRTPKITRRPDPRLTPPSTTQQLMRTLIINPKEEKRKQIIKKPIRKPQRYNILPTITQQIYRVRRKKGKVKKPTGFEALRI